jgi:bifunctional DNA-binding transcriptional regulator/antitoxin component of YhaV-PrlF toxin-antitoxin module
MAEKVRVGARGEIVLLERLLRKFGIEAGAILEINETKKSLLLRPPNPIAEFKRL